MKKFKKLLSVLMAALMMLSCFTVVGSAYQAYEDPGEYYYDSNDNPRAYLYTDEQTASAIVDMVDELLASANITFSQDILFWTLSGDFTSLDKVADTIVSLNGIIGLAQGINLDLGALSNLDFGDIDDSIEKADEGGAVKLLDMLLDFLRTNAYDLMNDIVRAGNISLGMLNSALPDMSAVNEVLADLPDLLGGLIYGIGNRKLTNGIGSDPSYPNTTAWEDLADADKPNFDTMVQNLLYKLLLQPNNTMNATSTARNDILTDPAKYGIDSSYLHTETVDWAGNPILDEDGNAANWWYIYGTQDAATGNWAFTKESTVTNEDGTPGDKHYITCWNEDSALVKGAAAEQLEDILNLSNNYDLYTMLEKAIPWAYDTFGGHNLDGQLRATLMQFCGAFNNAATVDDATKEELKAIMDSYKEMEDDADGDKKVLRDAFKNATGVAGNYNFMYISLSGADINTMPDDLYYVVEWGQSYEYYHVEFNENDMSTFFQLIDWEYQAPMWSEIMDGTGWQSGESILNHINTIVGKIITTAVKNTATGVEVTTWNADGSATVTETKDLSLTWTAGTGDNALVGNLTGLIKLVLQADTRKLFGSTYHLPYGFADADLEDVVVELAKVLVPRLMPALILPDSIASVEEAIVYVVREVMADILPHTGTSWDNAIAGASTEDEFLDIALSMGSSIGIYYLQNLIGLGTKSTGSESTSTTEAQSANMNQYLDATKTWKEKINYILDWIIATYLDRLDTNVVAKYNAAMTGTDPLAKFSAILSTLAPSLVKILGAYDTAAASGNNVAYAINLQTVYDDLRAALNGDFSGLGNGLERDTASGSSANMKPMKALATLIVELFGGLGFDTCGSNWTTLKGYFDTAAASNNPLTTLLGAFTATTPNDKLASLLEYLIICLADTRDIWGQNVLTIVLSLALGYEKSLSYSMADSGIEAAYVGAASTTLSYDIKLDVSGMRSYFNSGRYKSGTGTQDGTYSATIIDATVYDENGKSVATKTLNATLGANETYNVNGLTVTHPATPKIYTVVTRYRVKLPSQTSDANNEVYEYRRQVVFSAQTNDAYNATPVTMFTANKDNTYSSHQSNGKVTRDTYITADFTAAVPNVYISDTESLSKAANVMLTFRNVGTEHLTTARFRHNYSKLYISGYGSNSSDETTGKITILDDNGATHTGLAGRVDISVTDSANGTSTLNPQDAFFKYNFNASTIAQNGITRTIVNTSTGITATESWDYQGDAALWAVDPTYSRADYTSDFTTYKVTLGNFHVDFAAGKASSSAMDEGNWDYAATSTLTTYITLYNEYNLSGRLSDVLEAARNEADYDLTTTEAQAAWSAYETALTKVLETLYGGWIASSFASAHTVTPTAAEAEEFGYETSTVSAFLYYGDVLEAAAAKVDNYKAEEEAASSAVSHPSENEYAEVYELLTAMQEKELKNHDWVLYRWYEYWDDYNAINTAINALTPPAEEAYDTLVGLETLGEDLNAAIATISDADVKAIVQGLVEAPTAEAQQAVADAYKAYADGYDALVAQYDPVALAIQANQMVLDGTEYTGDASVGRLLPKYDADEYYFLEKAIADYGNVAADGYSEKSYEKYANALAYAKEVLADAKNNASSQYVIFTARYELLVAYKALVLADEQIDVAELKAIMAEAQAILDAIGTEDEFSLADDATVATLDEAYEQLVMTMGLEVTYDETDYYVGGEYTGAYALSQEGVLLSIKKQGWVDEIEARIQDAIDNFKGIASEPATLMVEEGFEYADYVVIDTNNTNNGEYTGIVYGIDTLDQNEMMEILATLDDALTTSNGDEYLQITANDMGMESTGALIEVLDEDGNAIETYVFVYFGDVDGDGMLSANDALIAEWYEIAYEGIESYAAYVAADLDGDGMPSANDALIAEWYEIAYEGVDYQYNLGQNAVNNMYEWIY